MYTLEAMYFTRLVENETLLKDEYDDQIQKYYVVHLKEFLKYFHVC